MQCRAIPAQRHQAQRPTVSRVQPMHWQTPASCPTSAPRPAATQAIHTDIPPLAPTPARPSPPAHPRLTWPLQRRALPVQRNKARRPASMRHVQPCGGSRGRQQLRSNASSSAGATGAAASIAAAAPAGGAARRGAGGAAGRAAGGAAGRAAGGDPEDVSSVDDAALGWSQGGRAHLNRALCLQQHPAREPTLVCHQQ